MTILFLLKLPLRLALTSGCMARNTVVLAACLLLLDHLHLSHVLLKAKYRRVFKVAYQPLHVKLLEFAEKSNK